MPTTFATPLGLPAVLVSSLLYECFKPLFDGLLLENPVLSLSLEETLEDLSANEQIGVLLENPQQIVVRFRLEKLKTDNNIITLYLLKA